jgi:hypothetical protein
MDVDPKHGSKQEQRYRDLNASLILSDGPAARKHFWSAGVAFVRHENEMEVGDRVVNENVDSRTTIVPLFNYGTPALRSERANLYLGVNTSFPITIFDAIESENQGKVVKTSEYNLGMTLVPNIVSEVLLNKNVMFFWRSELRMERNPLHLGQGFVWRKITPSSRACRTRLTLPLVRVSSTTTWLPVNLSLGDSFFTDTKAIFNGEGVFIKFGGFIYF